VTLTELGEIELARGRPLNARSLQLRALEIADASGVEDTRLASILARLALVYLYLSELNNAERSATRAVGIFERVNGPYHVATAQVLITFGNIARLKHRHDEAAALFSRAWEGFARSLGTRTGSGNILIFEAENEADRERFSVAEALYTEAVAQLEQDFGSENFHIGIALSSFGDIYTRQKKYAQAEPLLRRALIICEKTLGPQHPAVAHQLTAYASVLRRLKRKSEAEQFEARARSVQAGSPLSQQFDLFLRVDT